MNNIILGAGISGFGAWYADNDAVIYEKDDQAGGLCGAINIQGFHFDKAVHLSFSKNDLVRELFSKTTKFYEHHPIPKSWYHDIWMQHPAQNNLYPLTAEEKSEAIIGFINRDQSLPDDNFRDWNRKRYGEYLWEHFFKPYNSKYWDIDLGTLGCDWIGNRIYQPSIKEVLYGSYTDETPNTYYAPEMRYPENGGYYAFIKAIVDRAEDGGKIHYNHKAVKIDIKNHIVVFDNGTEVKYDELYSSVPLPQMLTMINDVPDKFSDTGKFDYTGVAIVSIGLKKSNIRQMWLYIYDEDLMAARAYMPSVKSPNNTPGNTESIQFEIYFSSKKDAPTEEDAVENCKRALERMGVANKEDILFTDYRILPFGNVVLKNGDEEYAKSIVSWLNSINIHSIGRFGRWEYLWSDQAFLSGYNEIRRSL